MCSRRLRRLRFQCFPNLPFTTLLVPVAPRGSDFETLQAPNPTSVQKQNKRKLHYRYREETQIKICRVCVSICFDICWFMSSRTAVPIINLMHNSHFYSLFSACKQHTIGIQLVPGHTYLPGSPVVILFVLLGAVARRKHAAAQCVVKCHPPVPIFTIFLMLDLQENIYKQLEKTDYPGPASPAHG